MEILDFLGGQGMFMILALFVVLVVLYNKIKTRRYHKSTHKKK